MNILNEIPETIKNLLLADDYFSETTFIKSYSSNSIPSPITKVHIAIELGAVNVKDLSFPVYLGKLNDDENYFGSHTEITVILDIYSPQNIGASGCYDTFFKICNVLSSSSIYNINNAYLGTINYDEDTFCFKSSCKININLFMAKQR